MTSHRGWAGPLAVRYICAAIFLFSCTSVLDGGWPDWMERQDITCLLALQERYEETDKEDQADALSFREMADIEAAQRDWIVAMDDYEESIMWRPSVRALLGMAYAQSRIRSLGKACSERVSEEMKHLGAALSFLDLAHDFRQFLGTNSDADDRIVARYQRRMVESQRMLLERQRKCFVATGKRPERGRKRTPR